MKVKLEIEFEMIEAPDDTVERTQTELLNSICINDSDVIDGFELTTHFYDGDNTSDFYIVPSSATIISKGITDYSYNCNDSEDEIMGGISL